ncbi:YdeI/OmpD-associated family protein [Daejeonella sp.]|uniref:YdeI/OmpD-associated family protein n=1 Tax=Daejeonella sp. TaxID=2805397 RepID=UPI0030C0FB6B
MKNQDPRIDEYIANSVSFAQPILIHLRHLIHESCPDVTETMKWSFPHFEYSGEILCSMASFKKHCSFGFWKASLMNDPHNLLQTIGKTAMGSMGQIIDVSDLPSDTILNEYIKEAAQLNREGVKVPSKPKTELKKDSVVADDIIEALGANPAAMKTFESFSPSNKKEYVEWITGAKTEATRKSRLESAVEWMAEGKIRHWKYVTKSK